MDLKRTPDILADEAPAELLDLGDAFFELDREWRIIRVNRNQEKLSHKPREETLGRVFWEVWPETADPASVYWREYHRCMDERVPVQFEEYYAPLDLWTGVTAYPVSTGGIAVFFRDVSAQKRAEQALRAEHAFTAAILETVANVVVVLDAHGLIVRVNAACRRLTGYTAEELIGRAVFDVFIPEDELPGVRQTFQALRAGQFPNHHENRWRMKDGSERTLAWDNTAILDRSGEVEFVIATGVDVTDRRRDEQRLREGEARLRKSEERLRAEVESTPLALVEWDSEYRVAGYSRRAEELFGWTRDEVIGKRIDEIPWVREEDWPAVRAVMRDMSSGARPSNVNANRNVRKDGEVIACEWYNSTLRDETGRLVSVLSLVLDVTERTRAEEAARRGEAVLAEAGAMAHLGAWWIEVMNGADVNDNPLRWSDETYRIFGFEPGEVPISNQLFFEHVHPDDRERIKGAMADALAARERYALEHRIVRRDGEERLLVEQGKGDYDPAGRLVRIVGAVQDVTERRRAEQALQRSEQRLQALADSMPQLAWTARADGFITWYNRRWYEYTGTTPEEMEGWGWQRVHDPAVLPGVLARWKASIATGDDFEMQFPLRGADGRFRRFLTRVYAMKDERGSVIEWFGTNTDVTDLVQAQEALREADRRKDEFLGMLSHELRNPLAPIRNALYILDRAAPLGEQARRAKEVATRQVAHMTRLVDDLLDVTRIARGKIELRRADVDLAALAHRTAEDHRALMHDRRLELEVQLPTEQIIVNADEVRLAQVLGNLLHNAAKFTPAGGRVTLAVAADADRAVIRVRDTGPGIAPEVMPTIFEPFTQAKQTLARTEGGLGLGLALVKGLVAMHGGEVHAYSPGQGNGTEFVVTLPLALARRAPTGRRERVADAPESHGRRVLVIDDNRDAADTVAELVQMLGHDVEVAYDAHDGLEKASEELPHVVFCDIGLPGMDGYEVARQIRAREGTRRVRLVALSGYAQPDDVERALAAGFDVHLSKPPALEELQAVLANAARGAG